MFDYRNRPLRKPMARWSLLFGGVLTLLFTFIWVFWDREPPGTLVSLVGTFIAAPPAVYALSSSWEATHQNGQENGSEDA